MTNLFNMSHITYFILKIIIICKAFIFLILYINIFNHPSKRADSNCQVIAPIAIDLFLLNNRL